MGSICEINMNDCTVGACFHGGVCIDKVGGFECQCTPGYVGPRCEGDVNECLSNPCTNPGTQACVQLVNDFRCDCMPGYAGHFCEKKVDLCHNSPCQNGGVCTVKNVMGSGRKRKDVRHCTCQQGYHGDTCQYTGYPCETNLCMNGGSCVVKGDNFICKCPMDVDGDLCENDRSVSILV